MTQVPDQVSAGLPGWAYGVRRLVVFSGAGISTDSGIPDFRGPSGAWTLNPGSEKKHTYQAFMADPGLRSSYWKSRAEHQAWTAEPNAGHLAVASLAGSAVDTTVVTQNTDGLHQRAGTPPGQVIELHGTMHQALCVECGNRLATTDVLTLLGESLVEAYEQRAGTENGLRGLTGTLIGLAGRLADLGRAEQALAVARRSVETAGRLAEPRDYPARAAECLRRATELAQRQHDQVNRDS